MGDCQLVFLRDAPLELIGIILWGSRIGAQDSCLTGVVSGDSVRKPKYGIRNIRHWFRHRVVRRERPIMGLLYERSILALIIFLAV